MKQNSTYIPLHVHTAYSTFDSCIKIDELIELAGSYKMPALAMTDYSNMSGAIEFYKKASNAGIKPIIGCDIKILPETNSTVSFFRLVLLAENKSGYKNLINLVSRIHFGGIIEATFNYWLSEYSKGLIALSGSFQGEIAYYLSRNMAEAAQKSASVYKDIFGPDNFYIEIQRNSLPEQEDINIKLLQFAKDQRLNIVSTSNCHYLRKEDYKSYQALVNMKKYKVFEGTTFAKSYKNELYLKSPMEMKEAFKDIPEALMNSVAIAERCNIELKLSDKHFPKYETKNNETPYDFLSRIAYTGLKEKIGPKAPQKYKERMETELGIIREMGLESNFLIVWDYMTFAKQNGILARNTDSITGSLAAYCCGITEIDPVKYNLLFECFLKDKKTSIPSIAVHFCKDGCQEVVSYIRRKYGRNKIAQIANFVEMGQERAVSETAKILGMEETEIEKIKNLIPLYPYKSLDYLLKNNIKLKEIYDSDLKVKELMDISKSLERLYISISERPHAMVITPEPLTEYTPIYWNQDNESFFTQYDRNSLGDLGIAEFYLYGDSRLTLIKQILSHLKSKNINLSLSDIPLDDRDTYNFLATGYIGGFNQFAGEGVKKLLAETEPKNFEEIITLLSLYKPGKLERERTEMERARTEEYIKRKKGAIPVKYEIPELEEILCMTYGMIIYHEQIIQIAFKVAKLSFDQAEAMRKAIANPKKRIPEEYKRQKELFTEKSVKNGIAKEKAIEIFNLLESSAPYTSQKLFLLTTGYISYQTAYLKAHYPEEFMEAVKKSDEERKWPF